MSVTQRWRRAFLVWPLMAVLICASAQNAVHVTVRDSLSGEPLPDVGGSCTGTPYSSVSGVDGRMVFSGIPAGEQHLRFVLFGYRTRTLTLLFPLANEEVVIRLASATHELEEAVVSATRTGSRIEDVPQKIEVLGSEELQEEGSLKPGNVASLIGDVSSVQVQQISAVSGAGQVRMQGLQGRHTLLLRDGMPAYGGISGGFDILRLPPLDLERVELLKGPSSTFHGGGAIAGTIDFISKQPADSLAGLVMANVSSLQEANMNAYLSGPVGKAAFTLFAGSTVQRAVDVDGDGWSDVPELRQYQVHPQLFLEPSSKTTLRIGVLAQNEQRNGGRVTALTAALDTNAFTERINSQRVALDVIGEHEWKGGNSFTVKANAGRYWQTDLTSLDPSAMRSVQDNMHAEGFWKKSAPRNTSVIGADVTVMELHGGTAGASQALSTVGMSAEHVLHRDHWPNVEFGLRADHSSFGTQVLPSIAALYKANERITLRANGGTGYMLPDRTQPYSLVPQDHGIPTLGLSTRPERSLGGTAEWTWRAILSGTWSVFTDQTFFITRIDDPLMITTDAHPALVNRNGYTLTRGIDNYVRVTHGGTELYLGYTWTVPQDIAAGSRSEIAYTPDHRAAMTFGHTFGAHWRAGIEASYNGPQVRYDGTRTGDQMFMAGMIGWKSGHVHVVLNGENLLDVRQTLHERVVLGTFARPVFVPLWAPIDGRAINLSMLYRFG